MLVPFEKKTSDLRDTVFTLVDHAADQRRIRAARAKLPMYWSGSIKWLFDRIENVFLLEFLILNVIKVHPHDFALHVPGFSSLDLKSLEIEIGNERVVIQPVFYTADRAVLHMTSAKHNETFAFFCDLTEAQPRWMAVVKETGVRRLLERYLPEQVVELDETTFRSVLNRCLVGPQPVFALDSDDLRQGLSRLLDAVTSESVRRSLALGVVSSASEVGRQLALAGPAVKQGAIAVLPARMGRKVATSGLTRLAHQPPRNDAQGS